MATIQKVNDATGNMDELALVEAAKKGDIAAFEELVKRYDRNVFRIAQHITQNREDAEDVVQDAFLKAYGNLSQFQGQSKFYTWLVRIAVNQAELRELLQRTIQGLPAGFRTVFVLRDVEGLSTEETAEALGLSIPAVKSRLLRARLQLRERLNKYFKRRNNGESK
jgi:RNA polymerase sigma-70 factor (ECF subfamily)